MGQTPKRKPRSLKEGAGLFAIEWIGLTYFYKLHIKD